MAGDQLEFGDDARSVALKRAWDSALRILAGQVNKVTYESYIRPIRPLSFDGRIVVLGVASAFAREWLMKRYANLIQSTLETLLDAIRTGPLQIQFGLFSPDERPLFGETPKAVKEPEDSSDEQTVPSTGVFADFSIPSAPPGRDDPPQRNGEPTRSAPSGEEIPSLPLNAKYVFANFVVGKSNRLAEAGAKAVAAAPGTKYNPLFIYGSSGLGKTHLLHAIGNAIRERDNRLRIALIDGENFTQQYVTALKDRKVEELRRCFRSVDVWLMDDIQFIAGKEQTKEEFFHTFNALYQAGKHIVISSDRSPRELRTMDERLRSRFESGLIADINPPELEIRVAILERLAAQEEQKIDKDILFYIASAIQSNIRTLEGALTKLIAYSSVMRTTPSIELAQSVLGEYFIDKPPPGYSKKGLSPETILRVVAEQFGTTVEAIKGQRRDKNVATARQIAMYLCREMTDFPLTEIGAIFGGRDHSTVQRAAGKIEATLPYDRPLHQLVQLLRSKLEQ